MKKQTSLGRLLSLLTAAALLTGLCVFPASAAESSDTPAASFVNTSGDGGENYISLCDARTFQAMIPVDMTEEEAAAAAETVVWSLDYDEALVYVDPELYPNHTQGGPLDSWTLRDGTGNLFTDVQTAAETVDGQVYLTVTFANNYYYDLFADLPNNLRGYQTNGGTYLDLSGWYDLTATAADGTVLGSVSGVKITPYDEFHTMQELYESMDELVAYAQENTDLYVVRESMGMSQGDNGLESLDMPYLIVAKDQAAVEKWQEIKAEAESDPTSLIEKLESGTLGDYQVPVLFSNIHSNEVAAPDGVMKFAWMLVEAAASEEGTLTYQDLTGFTAEGEAKLAEQMGPAGEEGSIAIPDLVADDATYLGFLKATDEPGTVSPWETSYQLDLEQYYNVETVTLDMDELLDDVFFLIVPEENVEGRTYVTRTSSGGFDLNRDNSFQTQAETQNMTQFIAEWNPVSFTEFHGQHKEFQCEPCDPPHEPNFEYDLLAEHLMGGGEALGIAAVANNDTFNSYSIPQRDYLAYTGETTEDGSYQTQWVDPWDDMSTSYTPQYSMLHGTVAYTVELPSHNDDAVDLVAYGALGQSVYVAENKESYLLNQTKIFERGVTNANSDAYELVGQWFTDQYDVEGAEAELFRPEYDGEGQNGNFYPECYIIPLDGANQSNLQAADEMLTYLVRNGVDVMIADTAFSYNGVEYPAGTAVVSMYQAKRSVAHGVHYDGTVITEWPVLYSEGITAFNYTRGFDMITCAEPAAYEVIAAACSVSDTWSVSSAFSGVEGENVVLMNASEASTSAVNDLLRAGKSVSLITSGEYEGSFLISYADWQSVSGDYLLTGIGVSASLSGLGAQPMTKAPVIYISGKPEDNDSGFVKTTLVSGAYQYNYDRQAMELLGFTVTDNAAEADLIIGAAALDDQALAAVQSGTPYIGYGSNAMDSAVELFADGALVYETAGDAAMDALAYVTYPTDSLITASYVSEGDDILYGYGAGYFAAIPEGAQVLVRLDSSRELLEGFLPSTGDHYADFLNDSIQAISYQGAGANGAELDVVLFANTLTNKVHQRDEFNFISNAAWAAVLGETSESVDEPATGYTDVAADAWYADAVTAVTQQGLMNGTGATTFGPDVTTDRAMLVTVLWRMAGAPGLEDENLGYPFADVDAGSWYGTAVYWARLNGVTAGTSDSTFSPEGTLTREQAVTMFYNYAKAQGVDVSLPENTITPTQVAPLNGYPDWESVSDWAWDAMNWAGWTDLITGTGDGTLAPQAPVSRAELATLLVRFTANMEG